jgi:DNA-binding response OmpR family regulator
MNRKALIVDENASTIDLIVDTLNDAEMPYSVAKTVPEARTAMAANDISVVILRGFGKDIRGADLCREIRQTKSATDVSVLIILTEDQLVSAAEALIAGANDLLLEPFEPRELRMRANIVPLDQRRRVDEPHTIANQSADSSTQAGFFIPEFNGHTKKFSFGKFAGRESEWELDPNTIKVSLDKMIVCPCCESVPTFRPGCGACGSAWVEQEVLLHHYACAHVGPESEFRGPSGLVCPKCRLTDLVAGSDFEQTSGCNRCTDCDAIFTEAKMIGHCLNCEHRFVASDGRVTEVYGYQVGASSNSALIQAPNYQTTAARSASMADTRSPDA